MAKFDSKTWNANVFEKYMQKVPSTKENSLVKNGLYDNKPNMTARLRDEVGGNFFTEPIKGRLDGTVQNYDGVEDVAMTSRDTFEQGKIIVGRMKGWEEKDFSTELTGVNWMEGIAQEVREYYDEVDQADILAILNGIFAMSDTVGAQFVTKHTYATTEGLNATTMNSAIQKACGDKKKQFKVAFMHSAPATSLENLNLLQFLKYTDASGIQRDLSIATYNGKLVVIDDDMPVEDVYELTTDIAIDPTKTYYTRSGSAGSYTYTEVTEPKVSDIGTYYEKFVEYTTYVMAEKFFEYDNVGVKVPNEMVRDAITDGGIDKLVTRQRKLFAPKFISFTKASMSTNSPTTAELATGSNWEIVNNGKTGVNKKYVSDKLIPLARIKSRD